MGNLLLFYFFSQKFPQIIAAAENQSERGERGEKGGKFYENRVLWGFLPLTPTSFDPPPLVFPILNPSQKTPFLLKHPVDTNIKNLSLAVATVKVPFCIVKNHPRCAQGTL